jgi:hypothetical protein
MPTARPELVEGAFRVGMFFCDIHTIFACKFLSHPGGPASPDFLLAHWTDFWYSKDIW